MAATVDNLQRQLGERLFEGDAKPAWLLIDAMGVDVRDVVPDEVPDEAVHVIPLGRKDIPTERYPHLVRMTEHDVELLRASLAWALDEQADPDRERQNGFAIGGWLQADVEPKTLARHLARCMTQYPRDAGCKYLRWADRRVLEWMWPTMDAIDRAALLGPATHWWTLDRIGQLYDHAAEAIGDINTSWRVTPKAWQHAQDCEPVQALIRGWQRFAELPADYLPQTAQAVHGARLLGLTNLPDIVLLGAYTLQVHPQLHTHPQVRAQVTKARQNGLALSDALGEITDLDGWYQIRDELTGATASADQTPRRERHG